MPATHEAVAEHYSQNRLSHIVVAGSSIKELERLELSSFPMVIFSCCRASYLLHIEKFPSVAL